jgi:uncharacterized protein YndB with AHSA1/START domain
MTKKNQTRVKAEPGKQELFITREFEAPRELVFQAFADSKILVRFLGPEKFTMKIDYYNFKSGGSYRYIHIDEKGNEYGFNGVVHEVTAPERVIQTFEFEAMPERGHVSLDTLMLEALPDNRTKLTIQSIFRSVADRDGLVMSGMEGGLSEGFNRLDKLLEKGF